MITAPPPEGLGPEGRGRIRLLSEHMLETADGGIQSGTDAEFARPRRDALTGIT